MPQLFSILLPRLAGSGLHRGAVVLAMGASLASFLAAESVGTAFAAPKKAQPAASVSKSSAPKTPIVAARYPLDPICPWGRIGDGQGILIRCLAQQEAIGLLAGANRGAKSVDGVPAKAFEPAVLPSAATPTIVSPTQRVFFRSVGNAKPDSGSLPEARPQLSKPKQRYVQCVEEHGGVKGTRASVVVKFLVRERGRAEGVSVKSRKGMGAAAAKCIAEVVDRRYVGFPEAPIVGVTLEIRLGAERIVP